jgi:phage terminase large subunit
MTGSRRKRFLDGVWAAAEGLVYDGYDPTAHLLPDGWEPPAHWPRVWSLDWGYNPAPIVLQFWALDPENRMHLYRETYRTRQTVQQLGDWAKGELDAGREPRPTAVVSDHETEKAAVFAAAAGVTVTPAEKFDKLAGIQQVQARFDVRDDGLPRIFFSPTARRHDPDAFLADAGRPTCTLEELAGYVWDTRNPDRPKDVPLDRDDHGLDSALYACRYVDAHLCGGPPEYGYDAEALNYTVPL